MRNLYLTIINYLRQQTLNRQIMGSMMAIAIMLIIVVGFNWIAYENHKFNTENVNIRKQYIQSQKDLVKREVTRTINYINYIRSLSNDKLMISLCNRVETAWDIANNIYEENKLTKSETDIKEMIKDALRRYKTDPGAGYVFIYTLDGKTVLDPKNPSLEEHSSILIHDSLNNYMVKREIALMKEVDKGFINYYTSSSAGNSDSVIYKHSYIKKFKPYNWYIGSKEYLEDFENELKNDVLNRIANIRYEKDGYIFIQKTNNDPILSAGSIINDSKTAFVNLDEHEREKITKVASGNGGFIEYQYHRSGELEFESKVSYVELIKEWNWIIGAGFYKKDIDNYLLEKRKEISAERIRTFIRISIGLLFILILGLTLTYWLNKKIKQGFNRFDKFFTDASEGHPEINADEFYSPEFKSLAVAAHKMVGDLKYARTLFEKEHSLLRSVMNSIPDMVFFKDVTSRYVGCNDAFLEFIQIREEDFVGKTDFELFSKESADFYYNNDLKILQDGIPIRNEEWVTMPDGSKCLFDTVKVLCHDRTGKVIGILCISRDMTEKDLIQKKYIEAKEKAEESDRLKTAFLANMSHEIRTPMNSIVGFSNLIAEGCITKEEQTEYVEHINTAINNLLNLINDIIDIAKIEAGQLNIRPEYYSLGKLMEEVYISTAEYKKRFNKSHVQYTVKIAEDLKNVHILIDPFRLNQVLTNLVVNAIKFTHKGSIELGCEIKENGLYFYVSDTGLGINEKDQNVIFNRFRQVGENNGYKAGGTGLGLAISKHLIELMNGTIGVNSEKDKGSLFYFNIPFYPLTEELNSKVRLSDINWKNKTILIVENEDASFNYLKAVFSGIGAKTLRAFHLNEIQKLLINHKSVNLVYVDLNGHDEIEQSILTEIKSNFSNLQIIGQSNYPVSELKNSLPLDAFIIKPVQYHLLLHAISQVIVN